MLPTLTFFSELEAQPLEALFTNPQVIPDLKALNAGVSLGILDLSSERASVVQRLNQANIPVTAWLLLPKDQGYWFNSANAAQAARRYSDFKTWTAQHDLKWAAIGLDIEPDINEAALVTRNRFKLVPLMLKRLFDQQSLLRAEMAYASLATRIQTDGYLVESYHIPMIVDERKAGSTLLKRLGGLVDFQANREVLMLYSSFMRPIGDGLIWSYGPQADSIGVGNTGGGVDIEGIGNIPPMTWAELTRDLRLAYRLKKPVHIFCLEGCVKEGYLTRLRTFDWEGPVTEPMDAFHKVHTVRRLGQAGLWASAHPLVIMGSMWILGFGFSRLFGRKSKPALKR
jgi:hypothetical protein